MNTPPSDADERLAASRAHIERLLADEPPHRLLQVISPWAHRHPWALVSASAAAGALFVAARPWRWLPPPAVLGSLLSQIAIHALDRQRRERSQMHSQNNALNPLNPPATSPRRHAGERGD